MEGKRDGWGRSAVVGNTRNCTMQCKHTVTTVWKAGRRGMEGSEGGAVVGNEREFLQHGKTRSLSQAGWLAPLLLLSSSSSRRERERERELWKDFLVPPTFNVIFFSFIPYISFVIYLIYANLFMPSRTRLFLLRKRIPPPSPHLSPLFLFPALHSSRGTISFFLSLSRLFPWSGQDGQECTSTLTTTPPHLLLYV